jgi:hypothetical protein
MLLGLIDSLVIVIVEYLETLILMDTRYLRAFLTLLCQSL